MLGIFQKPLAVQFIVNQRRVLACERGTTEEQLIEPSKDSKMALLLLRWLSTVMTTSSRSYDGANMA